MIDAPTAGFDLAEPLHVSAPAGKRVELASLSHEALAAFFADLGEKPFRARQVFRWIHQRNAVSFAEMTDLSKALREELDLVAALHAPVIDQVRVARDGTRKYQLRTHDGHLIESVFIPNASGPGKNALCISSQVGCAMGCTFCATASLKLARHLTPGEIVGQLYAVMRELDAHVPPTDARAAGDDDDLRFDDDDDTQDADGTPDADLDALRSARELRTTSAGAKPRRRLQNIVYMGMGEPLHNYEGVTTSIALLTDSDGQSFSPRRLTVSTSGLVPAIEKLGNETDVHLAISLNGTTDEVRSNIMPVNRRWSLEALLAACRAFPLRARRRITFEYVLLAGVNDTDDDARRLVALLHDQHSKVNLIPFNPHPLSPFERPSALRVETFKRILERAEVSVFVRTTRGLDIDAACGMLGAQKLERARSALPVVD